MRLRTPLLALLGAALSGCATNPPGATASAAQDQRPSEYQPKRVAPSAMEAWIAPWEDATGDLYPPSTVYIEVDPERWQYSGSPERAAHRPAPAAGRAALGAEAQRPRRTVTAPGPRRAGRRRRRPSSRRTPAERGA